MLNDKISTLKLTPPVTVDSSATVGELVEHTRKNNVGCVLVYEGGRLAGIITERDILLKVVARAVGYDEPVHKFMTKDPVVLAPGKTIGDAVSLMIERNFRHIPVVRDNGEAHGIVSIKDVISLVAEFFPQQVLNLPPRPHQKMQTPEGG